jgi:hypothetical protein
MTLAHEIHGEFRSTLGKFTLGAVFTVPATGITMLFGPSQRHEYTSPLRGTGLAAHRHFKGCPQSGPVGQKTKKKPGIQPGAPKADPLQPAGKS